MLSNEGRRHLSNLAVFCVPVFIVKATSVILGGGSPTSAEAAPVPVAGSSTIVAATVLPDWDDQQLAAATHIEQLAERPYGAVPLFFEKARRAPVIVPSDQPDSDAPSVMLQAILTTSSKSIAWIDGKAYRIGDLLAESAWRVIGIDDDKRSVVIREQSTKREHTLTVRVNDI